MTTLDHMDIYDVSFPNEQGNDSSLKKCFINAKKADFHKTKNEKLQFYLKMTQFTLFRFFALPIRSLEQLVVPVKFREDVLKTIHDSFFAGHLGRAKTARIQSQFFGQGLPVMLAANFVHATSFRRCLKIVLFILDLFKIHIFLLILLNASPSTS